MFCLPWKAKKQTNQICSLVFWENLRHTQTAFGFIWPLEIPSEIEPHLLKFNAFNFCHPLKKGRCPMSMLEQLSAGTIYVPFLSRWKKWKYALNFSNLLVANLNCFVAYFYLCLPIPSNPTKIWQVPRKASLFGNSEFWEKWWFSEWKKPLFIMNVFWVYPFGIFLNERACHSSVRVFDPGKLRYTCN